MLLYRFNTHINVHFKRYYALQHNMYVCNISYSMHVLHCVNNSSPNLKNFWSITSIKHPKKKTNNVIRSYMLQMKSYDMNFLQSHRRVLFKFVCFHFMDRTVVFSSMYRIMFEWLTIHVRWNDKTLSENSPYINTRYNLGII